MNDGYSIYVEMSLMISNFLIHVERRAYWSYGLYAYVLCRLNVVEFLFTIFEHIIPITFGISFHCPFDADPILI